MKASFNHKGLVEDLFEGYKVILKNDTAEGVAYAMGDEGIKFEVKGYGSCEFTQGDFYDEFIEFCESNEYKPVEVVEE